MYDWDLQVLPGPPRADLKRDLLDAWLRNPFLDDDATDLSLRLGAPVAAVREALDGLCADGLLRRTGAGWALGLDLGGSTPPDTVVAAADAGTLTPAASAPDGVVTELASLSGAVAVDPEAAVDEADDGLLDLLDADGDTLTRQIEQTLAELLPGDGLDEGELIEALPFGLLALAPTGTRELANRRAAEMLGLAPRQLDGATFEMVTGVNPLTVLDRAQPLCFSLTEPRSLEVTLTARRLPSGMVILALIRDVALLQEMSQIQAEAQEELFARLRTEMVDPLAWIERFLEAPDAEGLVQARMAMEQINWFLQEFLLRTPRRHPDES